MTRTSTTRTHDSTAACDSGCLVLPAVLALVAAVLTAVALAAAGVPLGAAQGTVGGGSGAVGASDAPAVAAVTQDAPFAICEASPRNVTTGETVTLDASGTDGGDYVEFDVEGDGTYDILDESDWIENVSYSTPGTYEPVARATGSESSDEDPCGTVVVTEPEPENQPPSADFDFAPPLPAAGEEVTFDASASTDPDGTIATYTWDFDDDGITDDRTVSATTTHTFPTANVTGENLATVSLTVEDDDGETDSTTRAVELLAAGPGTVARCTAEPREVGVGEPVTLDASESTGSETYEWDLDGDGTIDTDLFTTPTYTTTYEEPGAYAPRVRVSDEDREERDTDGCGEIVVVTPNEPPVADLDATPSAPAPGEEVTLDASGSTDSDGRIVRYEWDVDGDGTTDTTTNGPTVTAEYDSSRTFSPRVTVHDDDGATDTDEAPVEVGGGDDGPCIDLGGATEPMCLFDLPTPVWLLGGAAGGGGAGYAACRRRTPTDVLHLPGGGDDGPEGIQAYAAGTFPTPDGGGTATVDGLGFEPDLVVLTATNGVGAGGGHRSAGWSHGAAVRTDEGFAQHVVSVGDDDSATDAGVSATHWGKAVDVLVHGDDEVGSIAGAVTGTSADGFEVTFDDSTLPADASGRYAVHYRAFDAADQSDVQVGHFPVPEEPGTQTVPLGTDADYVALAASTVPGGVDAAATTDRTVGLSLGRATAYPREPGDQPPAFETGEAATRARSSFRAVDQHAVCSSLATDGRSAHRRGVFDDRVLHLPGSVGGDAGDDAAADAGGDPVTARVTDLGASLELTFDEVGGAASGSDGSGEDGSDAGAGGDSGGHDVPRVVTFVAVNAGADRHPALGTVRGPPPGAATEVDLGFEPGAIEVTAVRAGAVGREEVAPRGAPFDWSEGTALPGPDGTVLQQVLHPSLATADRPAPVEGMGDVDPLRLGVATPPEDSAGDGPPDETGSAPAAGGDATAPGSAGPGDATDPATADDVADGGGPRPRSLAAPSVRSATGAAGLGTGPESADAASGGGPYRSLARPGRSPPAVAVALARDDAGGILGRDEVAVASVSPTGFRLATDWRAGGGNTAVDPRPVLAYAAWPSPGETTPPVADPDTADGAGGGEDATARGPARTGTAGIVGAEEPPGGVEADGDATGGGTDHGSDGRAR